MKKIGISGIITIMLASMLTIMVGSAIAPALVEITAKLHFIYNTTLLITLPSLGVVLFFALPGKLLPKTGALKLLCIGLVPYAFFGYMGAFLQNNYLLILDRILLGGAAAIVQVASTALIAEHFAGKTRMTMIAWQGMAIEAGGILFLLVGGWLGELKWSYPFLIYLLAFIFFILALITIPKKATVRDDEALSDSISSSGKSGIKVLILFAGAFFAQIIFFIAITHIPGFLHSNYQFSESQTGYIMAFISLIAVFTASQLPRLVKYFTGGCTITTGFIFFAIGYAIFSELHATYFLILAAFFLGLGFGCTVPVLNHMMVEVSNAKNRGKNLSLYTLGIFGGQFASSLLSLCISQTIYMFRTAVLASLIVTIILGFSFHKFFKQE